MLMIPGVGKIVIIAYNYRVWMCIKRRKKICSRDLVLSLGKKMFYIMVEV